MYHLLETQEWSIPTNRKSSKDSRRSTWIIEMLSDCAGMGLGKPTSTWANKLEKLTSMRPGRLHLQGDWE